MRTMHWFIFCRKLLALLNYNNFIIKCRTRIIVFSFFWKALVFEYMLNYDTFKSNISWEPYVY